MLDVDCDAQAGQGARRMWAAKYTLRSHFDGVRHVLFHPSEPVVFTASEDHTIKLWHLNRTLQSKKWAPFLSFAICLSENRERIIEPSKVE